MPTEGLPSNTSLVFPNALVLQSIALPFQPSVCIGHPRRLTRTRIDGIRRDFSEIHFVLARIVSRADTANVTRPSRPLPRRGSVGPQLLDIQRTSGHHRLAPPVATSETLRHIRVTSRRTCKTPKNRQVRDQCTIGAGAPAGLRRSSQTAHTRRAQSACRARTTRRTTKTNALYFLFAQTPSNLIHSQPSLSIGTRYLRDRPPSGRAGSANRRWQTVNDFKKERAMLDHEGQATGGQSETLPVEFKFRDHSVRTLHE